MNMKLSFWVWILLPAVVWSQEPGSASRNRASNSLVEIYQRGLIEEEANHNPTAAIRMFEGALAEIQAQRQLGAALLFHLGQSWAKLGKTNEARSQFQRLAREYPDQAQLVSQFTNVFPGIVVRDAAMEGEIAKLKSKIASEQSLLKMLANRPSPELLRELPGEQAGGLRKLMLELKDAEANRAQAATKYKSLHPEMIRLETLHSNLTIQVDRKIDEMISGLQLNLKIDEQALESLQGSTPVAAVEKELPGQKSSSQSIAEDTELEKVRSLLRDSPDLVNFSLMDTYIMNNRKDVVEFLLLNGWDVNRRGANELTALHLAVSRGRKSIAQSLLEHGAKIDAEDDNLQTPLFIAAGQGFRALSDLLLRAGADPLKPDRNGRTPFHAAASQGNVLDLFLARNIDLDRRDRAGHSALHIAALGLRKPEAMQLIASRANLDSTDANGYTALSALLAGEQRPLALDLVRLLLEKGANPRLADKHSITPLHSAVKKWDLPVVDLLLSKGADLNATDALGFTPTYYALTLGREEIALALIDRGGQFPSSNEVWAKIPDLTNKALRDRLMKQGPPAAASASNSFFKLNPELARRYGLLPANPPAETTIPARDQSSRTTNKAKF